MRPHSIRRAAGAAACLLTAGLTACGGGRSATPTTGPPRTVAQAGSTSALAPELLTVADLPGGWVPEATGPASGGGLPACLRSAPSSGAPNEVEARFQQGSGLPTLQEVLASYGTPAAAATAYRTLDDRLGGCGELQFAAAGYTFTGRVEPLPGPAVGDEHQAFQAALATAGAGAGGSTTTTFDFVLVRKGLTVLVLIYAALGVPPPGTLARLVTAAASKVA